MATKLSPAEKVARQAAAHRRWKEKDPAHAKRVMDAARERYLAADPEHAREVQRLADQRYREQNREAINARLRATRAAKGR